MRTRESEAEYQKPKPRNIRERTFEYALMAIRLFQTLQERKEQAGWIIGKQYLRAATSIGANVEEAQSGESRLDFIHKYSIAQKEAKESLYWLRLLVASGILKEEKLSSLVHETEELISVITAIIVSAKRKTHQ